MKVLLSDDWSGFNVKEDILKALNLTTCHMRTLHTNPALIQMFEQGEPIGEPGTRFVVKNIPDDATDWMIINNGGLEDALYVVNGSIHFVWD